MSAGRTSTTHSVRKQPTSTSISGAGGLTDYKAACAASKAGWKESDVWRQTRREFEAEEEAAHAATAGMSSVASLDSPERSVKGSVKGMDGNFTVGTTCSARAWPPPSQDVSPPISAQASDRVVIHAPGTKVVILGCTQKIELNGRSGRVEEFDPESERYVIEMEGSIQGKRYEIRAANVAPHPHWRKKDKMDLHLQTYTQGMAVFDR